MVRTSAFCGATLIDRLRAETDNIGIGYAMGSLAANIEQRIAAHPAVPSETAAQFAAALRERGAALSFGAAREATANPEVFAYRGACYPTVGALASAVQREQLNPSGPVLREYTPEMARRGERAAMDRVVEDQ